MADIRAQRAVPTLHPMTALVHPLWLRITHWLNAIAVIVMIASGWQIYNASPIFGTARFPRQITLGGWLAGGLLWHFAAMWLLAATLLFYHRARLAVRTTTQQAVASELARRSAGSACGGARRARHTRSSRYNMVQRIAYVAVIVDIVVLVLSGLAIWKSVQFPLLRELMGGYDNGACRALLRDGLPRGLHRRSRRDVAAGPASLARMIRGHDTMPHDKLDAGLIIKRRPARARAAAAPLVCEAAAHARRPVAAHAGAR